MRALRRLHETQHECAQGRSVIHMSNSRGAITGAVSLANTQAAIVVSEFPLNSHESFRAEIIDRQGRSIVAISRWKMSPAGNPKRAGTPFEFAAHRTNGVAKIVAELQRVLVSLGVDGGAA